MADAHIPNSEVTPDWQELPYERTSFEKATELTPVEGYTGRYAGFATKDWCTPRKTNKIIQKASFH
jgi:hypothetical protein